MPNISEIERIVLGKWETRQKWKYRWGEKRGCEKERDIDRDRGTVRKVREKDKGRERMGEMFNYLMIVEDMFYTDEKEFTINVSQNNLRMCVYHYHVSRTVQSLTMGYSSATAPQRRRMEETGEDGLDGTSRIY